MNRYSRSGCLALLIALAGCQLQPNGGDQTQHSSTAPIQTLYQSSNCNPASSDDLTAVWLPDQASLDRSWRHLSPQLLHPKPPPQLSSSQHSAVLIHMGTKPSSGYAIELQDPELWATEQRGVIQLRLHQPQAGYAAAAVITNPCLLLELPEGNYAELQLLDQDRNPLLRLARPSRQ